MRFQGMIRVYSVQIFDIQYIYSAPFLIYQIVLLQGREFLRTLGLLLC
jgi:hypothetical protein